MKTITDWIAECRSYIAGRRDGLWPWQDALVDWLLSSGNLQLANSVKSIDLGPFLDDTDLEWIYEAQRIRLGEILNLLQSKLKDSTDKIFLSHAGINKSLVRDFALTLQVIGLRPWLDKDAMVAGTLLNRTLLAGMKQSCAAVFFITPEFRDEKFLATEIDYAIAEKRGKGEHFAIVVLQFLYFRWKYGTNTRYFAALRMEAATYALGGSARNNSCIAYQS